MCLVSILYLTLSHPVCFSTVSKGISANMLKISSKRRRTLKQIREDKEAAAEKEAENENRLQ